MPRLQLERQLALLFAPVSRSWRQLADQVLANLGVSNSMGWGLVFLDRMGPDVRQADLARMIGISQPSLVRTLHQLEAAGLIERRSDPDDRRSNQLRATKKGSALRKQIEERLTEERSLLLEGISDADLQTTLNVIGHLGRHIHERRAKRLEE